VPLAAVADISRSFSNLGLDTENDEVTTNLEEKSKKDT
jgi:hypothetical protein